MSPDEEKAGVDHGHSLAELKARVLEEIDGYANKAQPSASHLVGIPWSEARIMDELQTMRQCLVDPYWVQAEIRDTFEQIGSDLVLRRNCIVVADANDGHLLLFDPSERDFVLAQATEGSPVTIGVRGDAVGCFLAR
jgi:hypothetical protein